MIMELRDFIEVWDRCCQLALRQQLPNKQLVLMADPVFEAAGYALLIDFDPSQKNISTRRTSDLIANGFKTFTPPQIKMSIYAKKILAINLAFMEFGQIFRGTDKPMNIKTDSKSVTLFFQTK